MLARDVMLNDVATITADADLGAVARLLAATSAGAVVVVDQERRPIGMVTRSNVERAVAETITSAPPRWLIKGKPIAAGAIRPAPPPLLDVMTAPAIFVPDVARLLEFAQLMEQKKLKRLPVVKGGALVGLINRADVARALIDARSRQRTRAHGLTAHHFRELAARAEETEQARRAEARRLAEAARKKLIEELAARRLTDRAWEEMLAGARRAAAAGLKEYVMTTFPAELCADGGRAINAPDPGWPGSLRGEPRDIFERWRRELQPEGFGLAARIVSFPDGVPGDAALILSWGASG